MRITTSILCGFLVTGCATAGFNSLDEGLGRLHGQPIKVAFATLGYPDSSQKFGSDTVYLWANSQHAMMPMINTGTGFGMVGNVPIQMTRTSTAYVPAHLNCTIKVVAGKNDYIISTSYSGNYAGCYPYIKLFSN